MSHSMNAALLSFLSFLGLANPHTATFQGYAEGEYVLVAPQIPGTLTELNVQRGQKVQKGDALFSLENTAEAAALEQSKAKAARSEATLDDLLKAKRQPELDALIAQRDQAKAAHELAMITYERDKKQLKANAISQAVVDADKAYVDQSKGRLDEAEAAIAAGKLSVGRDDTIRAAQADVVATKAAVDEAQWRLDQKRAFAPSDALVFDTLYREGEFIPAGQAVVSLLPSSNIKVRFFVPEGKLATLPNGTKLQIHCNGCADLIPAHVSYVSPKAEYTPPELYNRDNRERLLFMLEATPDATPEKLHPGQPVDVSIAPP